MDRHQVKHRRKFDDPTQTVIHGAKERDGIQRILLYSLLPFDSKHESNVFETEKFDLHDVCLGHSDSFVDFHGVITQAGLFEDENSAIQAFASAGRNEGVSIFQPVNKSQLLREDIARRAHEMNTVIRKGGFIAILVPRLRSQSNSSPATPPPDLLQLILNENKLTSRPISGISSNTLQMDFEPYLARFGGAAHDFPDVESLGDRCTPISRSSSGITGFVLDGSLFLVPYTVAPNHTVAIEAAKLLTDCILNYIAKKEVPVPQWLMEFQFTAEIQHRNQKVQLENQIAVIDKELASYEQRKTVLFTRSEKLVDAVIALLREAFDLNVTRKERCIEDCIVTENERTVAVVEIKGENGSFKREHINQVDSHRERLELDQSTLGVLIMNTRMNAKSLDEKYENPHPDIIKKAVAENVLLIRTIDLLLLQNLIDLGKLAKERCRELLLTNRGWVRVKEDQPEIICE